MTLGEIKDLNVGDLLYSKGLSWIIVEDINPDTIIAFAIRRKPLSTNPLRRNEGRLMIPRYSALWAGIDRYA